jgi:hypothetical protein
LLYLRYLLVIRVEYVVDYMGWVQGWRELTVSQWLI